MHMTLPRVARSSFIRNLFFSLAVLTAYGIVNPAAGQTTVLFDFETAPDIAGTNNIDPVFIDPVTAFTLSHDPGPVDGNAQWADDGGTCIPRAGAGCVRLSDDGTGATAVTTTINFSGPVSSITLWAANFFTTASITPILAAGGTLPAIPVPATGMGTGTPSDPFTVTYSEFNIVGSGPYIGLEMNASVPNQLSWDDIEVTLRGETSARDVPTPTGEDIVVLDIEAFQQVASKVIVAGSTDADFCVAPDIREIVQNNGRERYISRPLALAELSGLGSCTGPLVPEETDTWEDLLSQIDLVIAPWYRSYEGEFDTESGHWFVIGVVRTSAEYEGPVAIVGFPETLIDFPAELECNADLDMRPLDLGGAVAAFGEVANIEGDRMIVETGQCNRSKGLTRRTTHVYPVRLDANARVERINVQWQLNGIEDTLTEVGGCILDTSPTTLMQLELATAREAFAEGRFDDAIDDLEDIARIAKDADFTSCPIAANYSGNLMSRGLTAAFTVWDRFWLADQGLQWTIYLIPFDLEVPVLTPTTPPTP